LPAVHRFSRRRPVIRRLIDDLAAVYCALISRMLFLRPICSLLEGVVQSPSARAVLGWFSPRKRRWSLTILVGILIGVLLVLAEVSEGGGTLRIRKLLVVAAVYIGLESAGVLMGYALLAKPLGLFRQSVDKA
jgi:hypothetical protein